MMRPKAPPNDEGKIGLLEYLEEIIGTNVYVPLIQEAEAQLENIGDELNAKNLRVEEAQKAVNQLEDPKNEALAYIELEKEVHDFANLRNQLSRYQYLNDEIKIEEDIRKIDENLKEVEMQFNEKKQLHIDAINEYQSKQQEYITYVKNEKKLKEDVEEMSRKYDQVEENKKGIEKKQEDTYKNIAAENKRKDGIRETLEELYQAIPAVVNSLQETLRDKEAVEAEYNARNAEIISATEEMQRRKMAFEKDLVPCKKQHDDILGRKEVNKQKIEFLLSERAQEDEERKTIENDIESCQENLEIKNKELQELERRFEAVQEEVKNKKESYEELFRDLDIAKKQLALSKKQLQDIEENERKAEGKSKLIQDINTAKRTGELGGILGRLGDLGVIDSKYDVAVSSAAARLDNIVAETVQDAEKLIEFVRNRNLGRINVIVLDKVKQQWEQRARAPFESPDARALRLFDIIKFDDINLEAAFYYAMSDTLVTETMDDARRIAFGGQKRYRVVTLTGEIINPSGEMQGFAKPKSGLMCVQQQNYHRISFSQNDIGALQETIRQLTLQVNDMNAKVKQFQSEIAAERKEKDQSLHNLQIMKNDCEGLRERLEKLISRQAELTSKSQINQDKELAELREIEKKNEQALVKILKVIENIQNQIEKTEKEIDEFGGEDFKELKKRRHHLYEAEEHLKTEAEKQNKKLIQCKKDFDKVQKKLNELESTKTELDQKFVQLKEESEIIEQKALEAIKLHEEAKIVKAALEKTLTELNRQQAEMKKEFDEILEKRNKLKLQRKDEVANLAQIQNEINKWDARIEKNRKDYQELVNEYQDVLGIAMEIVEEKEDTEEDVENPRKRGKKDEERKMLRFPVNKDFTKEEMENLYSKLETIKKLEVKVQEDLTAARPNLGVIQEYRARVEDKKGKEDEFYQVKLREAELRKKYSDLTGRRLQEFNTGFTMISQKLREMYRMITRGGDAELEFADSTDPFSEGIVFTVRPPNKSWKKMANLSGGEKTLSSLSLVFALHHYKPNALYVMDEVDAALDFQNVSVIANYIKDRTKNAQFIIVSLRYQMFELADRLIGVYKTRDVSQTITISPCSLKESDKSNPIIRQTLSNIKVN
ncbi:unnamed protein product [Blepharisma stoltei]|uniref:Structural maintenance of chromosomes protein 4 n=1 Tax=Blepharisma stoltei TaxID=1481888 RepID=A0AAU9IEF6_9CILI|nr:unnamed protein product [Blepharisma stoltei]